ncbi:DUF2237 family protein [Rudanella paleaurantiibacter]|uniref:DUF2237 family protein n=1 Tax=Rudanella paleaurantiibacter TaxID=2614655 RepID=A0A7J5TXE3_9BACT|nr:DUF2237 domain-containing protein [Rudanella paleaurantiibacter]KAB7729308.1 DUF2237 family protein [Rudanella paleaurantiibacter]
MPKNVLGGPLACCCTNPMTGFYRDGFCRTDEYDQGRHVVCAIMTEPFLQFTRSRGNDLSTPRPEYQFPGLKPGDRWCLCALRWREAYEAGVAPPALLACTHERALQYIELDALMSIAFEE